MATLPTTSPVTLLVLLATWHAAAGQSGLEAGHGTGMIQLQDIDELQGSHGRSLLQTCGYVCQNFCVCGCAMCTATQYQCSACGWNVTGNWWVFLVIVLSALVLMVLCSWLTCRYRRRRAAQAAEIAVPVEPIYPGPSSYYAATQPPTRIPTSIYATVASPAADSSPSHTAPALAVGVPAYPMGYPAVEMGQQHYPGPPVFPGPLGGGAGGLSPLYNASDMPPPPGQAAPSPPHADAARGWGQAPGQAGQDAYPPPPGGFPPQYK